MALQNTVAMVLSLFLIAAIWAEILGSAQG